MEVCVAYGGKARFRDFADALEGKGMSRRTIDKGLKVLVEMGVLERRRKRVKGRTWPFYVFSSEEARRIFFEMDGQLQAVAEELYKPVARAEMDPAERVRALVPFVEGLLLYHRALTLRACRLATQAPDEETFARRFVKFMSWVDYISAGQVAAALRFNSDVAEDVVDMAIGSLPPQVMELVSGREG